MECDCYMKYTKSRCAVYGVKNTLDKPGFTNNLMQIKTTINELISKGISTFITSAKDGYELNTAQYIVELKKQKADIHLIIARPYQNSPTNWRTKPILESVMKSADMVKYVSFSAEEYEPHILDQWIVSYCDTIICVTSSTTSKINRINNINLNGKNLIYIPPRSLELSMHLVENTVDIEENLYIKNRNTSSSSIGNKWTAEEEKKLIYEFNQGLSIKKYS